MLLALLGIAGGAAGGLAWHRLDQAFHAPGPLVEAHTVVIASGAGLDAIAARLEREGVVSSALIFRAGVHLAGRARSLKAGEYQFSPAVSPARVMERLAAGKVLVRALTVPEGLTSHAIVDLLAEAEGLTGTVEDIPPEGALLPETYHTRRGDSRVRLIARMQEARRRLLDRLWEARDAGLPLETREQALVLASIVEKETARAGERPLVAGVFINRLRQGMPLQSDPTVIYGLSDGTGRLGRALTRTDLRTAHAWNTYVIPGLPPSPICNPGADALWAVLHPAETKALFFVADGKGGHRFAETLEEHNRNVRAWRRLRDAN